ncbi:MAG: hypothetical protein K6A75_07275 [Ruminococcus sp.]|nr:hypothetical protein [Ruminococcus sp.]
MENESFISIIAIFISLYVIVLSIIGTSKTPVSEEVLKNKLDHKILRAIMISILVAVISVAVSAILPIFYSDKDNLSYINAAMLAINLGFFVYMFFVLLLLCQKNMDAMAKEIDKEEDTQTKTQNMLTEIRNLLLQKTKKK